MIVVDGAPDTRAVPSNKGARPLSATGASILLTDPDEVRCWDTTVALAEITVPRFTANENDSRGSALRHRNFLKDIP